MNNIVIFGANQVGKTTLIGYLSTHNLDEKDFSRAAKKNKETISQRYNLKFNKDMILPSFVSLDRDELRKFIDVNSPGTSKRTHRRQIQLYLGDGSTNQQCIFIDTPGTRIKVHEKYRGIFEGDIGICMLSLLDLDKFIELTKRDPKSLDNTDRAAIEDLRVRLFEPLQLWIIYKSVEKLIVVLTKMDMLSSGDINRKLSEAIEVVQENIQSFSDILPPVVPIGITITEEKESFHRGELNIYEPLKGCETTFIRALTDLLPRDAIYKGTLPFHYASIDKVAKIPKSSKLALRIKVLGGDLKLEDTPIIGPVLVKNDDEPVFLRGEIGSLKGEEDIDPTDVLSLGTIGGMRFKSLALKARSRATFDLGEIQLLKTSIVTSEPYAYGNWITLKTPADELSPNAAFAIDEIMPKEQVEILWFGKKIILSVVEKYYIENYIYISLLSDSFNFKRTCFALPCIDEQITWKQDVPLIISPKKNGGLTLQESTFVNFSVSQFREIRVGNNYMVKFRVDEPLCLSERDLPTELDAPYSIIEDTQLKYFNVFYKCVPSSNLGRLYKCIRCFAEDHYVNEFILTSSDYN